MPAIRCIDLVKEYHTQATVRALDGLDMEIKEGEIFGLLGPNGAGKTTLVRILTTLLRATSGHAEVCGLEVAENEQEVRRLTGYAGQDSERSAYFRLTVRENLLYFAHALRDVPLKVARERIEVISAGVGFTENLDRHFSALSGGQKQLVIVMRALLHHPKIVFMDEPSKSLDPVTADQVRAFFLKYSREHGMTILLTTHNMTEAEDFCDRIGFINRGQLRFVGTPRQFKRAVTVQEVVEVVGVDDAGLVAALGQIAGVTRIGGEDPLRLYCDDAFQVLECVLATLKGAGTRAMVSMAEPSLEDAYSIFVANDRGDRDGC